MDLLIKKPHEPGHVPKKIELVSCLQSGRNREHEYYFYTGNYDTYIPHIRKICKLATNIVGGYHGGYDLILCNERDLFLGYWNDGVL